MTPLSPSIPDVAEFLSEEQFRIYDTLLAVTLTLCTLVGLPGNIVSLLYFYSSKQRNFSSLIYSLVSIVDICICVVQIPVMIALFNTRRPGIFAEPTFCKAWNAAFFYLQQMSMFLVLLMSVSRSIKVIFLQYQIRRRYLVVSFLLYSCIIAIRFTMVWIFGRGDHTMFAYRHEDVQCFYDLKTEPFSYIDQLIYSLCVGIPPIVTTISFVIFIVVVCQKSKVSQMNKTRRQAAVTMGMFTILFLTCNLPCLVNNTLWFVTKLYHGNFYGSTFMFYYSWVISEVFCTVLNAALNPVLYFCRMKSMRDWVKSQILRTAHEYGIFLSARVAAINTLN